MPFKDPSAQSEYYKTWALRNKEKLKTYHHSWYENHKDTDAEKMRAKAKVYREENREKIRERRRERPRDRCAARRKVLRSEHDRRIDHSDDLSHEERMERVREIDAAADAHRNQQIKRTNPALASLYFGRNLNC